MRVGIIGAMGEELEFLRTKCCVTEKKSWFGLTFEIGEWNNIGIVLVESGIGKVNAAVGTSLLINHFTPDCVINVGVAGAFADEIQVGDIVLASEVRHHDVNVTLFGYEHGQVPQMPAGFQTDSRLVQKAHQLAAHPIHVGLIVSGDHYFDDEETVRSITNRFPHAVAAEMEAASIGHVCSMAKVPFLIIRSISDHPGRAGQKSFQQNIGLASQRAATLLLDLLETEPSHTRT
ncbi:5'-methylthioadenosine/adenosylhomocysteine nucleosidase [Brevibacillus ruminantium]|uniref:adenosylhomocysteine nucleosidase n=1 Tax=Brevibacillus ruminantium TaxID=2950604 RepID=A0ABY4WJX3_9BACL|nr:5'-methylthioadenosine/adenosylhomocysteine nucleosidase [Brevibacillus ruminantium]USG67387.1 5'-methylthioadenosine/adenosylhomocysteine nucleosidase [Brevibacillus ruminantium]